MKINLINKNVYIFLYLSEAGPPVVPVAGSVDSIRLPVQVTVADTPSSAGHGGGYVYKLYTYIYIQVRAECRYLLQDEHIYILIYVNILHVLYKYIVKRLQSNHDDSRKHQNNKFECKKRRTSFRL